MDDTLVSYKGVGITLLPKELPAGAGWMAEFRIDEEEEAGADSEPYSGETTYPTREQARLAALDSARELIDALRHA